MVEIPLVFAGAKGFNAMTTEQADEKKPGRYFVLLSSPEGLLRLAGVGLAGVLVFGALAVLIPDEQQRNLFIGAACSWLALSASSVGAWLYKRYCCEENGQQAGVERGRWLLTAGTIGLVALGAAVGFWSVLHFQGFSTESIADLFGKSGRTVLVSCLVALAILKVYARLTRD